MRVRSWATVLLSTMIAGLLNLLLIYDAFLGSPGTSLRPRPEESLDIDLEPEDVPLSSAPPNPPPSPAAKEVL